MPLLIATLSIAICLIFIQYYLHRTSAQFLRDFQQQNFSEISRSDTSSLAVRINSLTRNSHVVCASGSRNGHVFFQGSTSNCKVGLFRTRVGISTPELRLDFVLTLPTELQYGVGVFILLQVALLVAITWGARSFEQSRAQHKLALANLAAQVAHDIRSPVAALEVAIHNQDDLPADTRHLIVTAIGRIRSIANDLIVSHRESLNFPNSREPAKLSTAKLQLENLKDLIELIVSEKKLQFTQRRDLNISTSYSRSAKNVLINFNSTDFIRILSNLINNAAEAISGPGKITIATRLSNKHVEISVLDTGKGIPKVLLGSLMQAGATFGKASGSGLGLYHAKETIQRWSGSISVKSKESVGTKVTIKLPHPN